MSSEARDSSTSSITITRENGWFVATDDETGVASQGETKAEALANLAEALELHAGGGKEIDNPDEFLKEVCADSEENASENSPPWISVQADVGTINVAPCA